MEYCFEEAREDAMNIVKGIQKAGQTPQCFTFGALAEQSFKRRKITELGYLSVQKDI